MHEGPALLALTTLFFGTPHPPVSVPTGPEAEHEALATRPVTAAHAPAAVTAAHAPAAPAVPGLAGAGGHGAAEIPYFARRFGVSCDQCHVLPAKTNRFGEAFAARGYRMPGVEPRGTWPFAVWASSRWESRSGAEDPAIHVNRVEVISGGEILPWLSYFVEWRALSLESRSDGSLRDRSGRFEDLLLMARTGDWEVTLGQFRQVQQVDVSRRLSLSEPVVLSASLPGTGGATPRLTSLRAFSPAGRSPSVRLARNQPLTGGWTWTTSAALPVPGELSLPLTDEARREASNEVDLDPKGIFVESFARHGLTSFGAHVFYDDPRRYMANAIGTGAAGPLHWEAMAGAAKVDEDLLGRWSLEAQLFPHRLLGAGARLESLAGDDVGPALLPHLNVHFPGTSYTFRLTVEQRIQSGRHATLVEVGTLF